MNDIQFHPSPRILIIDDNSVVITFLEKFFESKNCVVESVLSGNDAIAVSREKRFELALVDIMLPDIKGDELFRKLRTINPELIGIIITGNATVESAIKSVEEPGIVGYETKPFDVDRLSTLVREVITRRRAEENLRLSEEKYRTFVENFQGLAFRTDLDFKPEFFHGAVEEITGFTEQEFVAGNPAWKDIIHPEDIIPSLTTAESNLRKIPNFSCEREYRIQRKDGETRWVHERLRNISDESGTPATIQGVVIDVTERITAEEEKRALQLQLQHSQKLEAVGRMAAGIAHDFNNILAAIMANASFGKENLTKKTFGYKQFDEILSASNLAKELVLQMLTFARNDKPNIRTGSINDVIRDSLAMTAGSYAAGVTLETDFEDSLPQTQFDSTQILQVAINLLNNARDAIGDIGSISVKTYAKQLDESFCSKHIDLSPGMYCVLEVADTGQGIDADSIQNIFDPFFTTKDTGKGTGLGLSVTLGIVKSHGGIIEVESEPGKGTCIRVFLPVIPSA